MTEFDEQTQQSKPHALLLLHLKTAEYRRGEETKGVLAGYEAAAVSLGCSTDALEDAARSPGLIALGAAWPWPHVTTGYTLGLPVWFETTQERYDSSLEVLPPIYFPGGFFVSEAATHHPDGTPVYAAFVQRGTRCFVREFPNTREAIAVALRQLDDALMVPA